MLKRACLLCCLLPLPALAAADEASVTRTAVYELGSLRIDSLMGAMHGPVLKQSMSGGMQAPEGPLWIKSFKVDILGGMSRPEDSLEFLCHAWVEMGGNKPGDERLLTVSQGMAEMRFPSGYAARVEDLQGATISAQALNDNMVQPRDVSYRVTIKYISEADAEELRLKNLRTVTAAINAGDAVKTFLAKTTVGERNGKICSDKGVSFLVPPGRHEYETKLDQGHPLTRQGGTIHAIKLHLHAYGESMSLIDQTTGKTIWEGKAQNAQDRALITHVDDYNSAEGIALEPGHRYAVRAVYANKSKEPVEAMAVLRIYLADEKARDIKLKTD